MNKEVLLMECNGYWETCKCEDCTLVEKLYEDLYWYKQFSEDFKEEIKELEERILSMGYCTE